MKPGLPRCLRALFRPALRLAGGGVAVVMAAATAAFGQGAVDGGAALVKVRGSYTSSLASPALTVEFTTDDTDVEQLTLQASAETGGVTGERAIMLPLSKVVRFHAVATNVANYQVSFAVPRGYQVTINGLPREVWTAPGARSGGSPVAGTVDAFLEVTVSRIVRAYSGVNGAGAGLLGEASAISWSAPKSDFGPPSIPWIDFNLGYALNGEPLPPLHLLLHNRPHELEFWSAAHGFYNFADTHPDLDFEEVTSLTQFRIAAPQVTVEYLQTSPYSSNGAANFDLKFYRPGETTNPFVTYSVVFQTEVVGVSYRYRGVTITKTAGGATFSTSLTTAGSGLTNAWNTVRLYGTWTLRDWYRGTNAARTVQVVRTATPPGSLASVYQDTLTTGDASLTQIATNQVIDYRLVTLTYSEGAGSYTARVHAAAQVTEGTTAGGETPYVSQLLLDPQNRLVGSLEPSGRTTASVYTGSGLALRPLHTARSWLDANPVFTAGTGAVTANGGETVDYLYTNDWTGAPVLPTSIRRRQGGTLVAESTLEYADSTIPVPGGTGTYPILTATRYDFSAAGAGSAAGTPRAAGDGHRLKSVVKTYRPDTENRLLRNRPHAIERPDGTKLSFTYESGDYRAGTFSVPGTAGQDLRVSIYHGAASGGTEVTAVSSDSGQNAVTLTVDPVRLVGLKSTKTVEIFQRGQLVRRESHVFTGGTATAPVFELLSWDDFSYDAAGTGELIGRTTSSNARYSATWLADRSRQTITDETGATTTIDYDPAGRPATITRETIGTVQQHVTTVDYDADHRVTQVSAGPATGERLVTVKKYTKAGLLDQVTAPDGIVTKFEYLNNARDVRTTYHYGTAKSSTQIVTRHTDGRIKEVTGTAVVEERYRYDFDSGRPRVTRRLGPAASFAQGQRPSLVVYDWLGRPVLESFDGFDPAASGSHPICTYYDYEPASGRLSSVFTKEDVTGLQIGSTRRMAYDEFGQLQDAGLDLDNSGTLAPAGIDRYQSFSTAFFKDADNLWWRQTTAKLYYQNTSASTHDATTRTRLGPLPAGMLAQSTGTDYHGNTATDTAYVSPSTYQRRLVSRHSDGTSVERVLAHGILTDERWFDDAHADLTGPPTLATTYHYDNQGRLTKAVDQRTGGNPLIQYYPGTARPWQLYDQRGVLVATHTYDAAGRLASTTTPAGVNEFDYTARGERSETKGTGAFPTRRTYNGLGELTELRTYRSGLAGPGDLTAWSYDPNTGWLAGKTDAASQITTYDYRLSAAGRDVFRTWARHAGNPSTTRYRYSLTAGDLQSVTYTGLASAQGSETADLAFTYTRSGQLETVTDASGLRRFFYEKEQLQAEYLPAYFGGLVRTSVFQTTPALATATTSQQVRGRYAGFMLGSDADLDPGNANADADKEMAVAYGFDAFGRVNAVAAAYKAQGARPALSVPATYRYKEASSLWENLTQGNYTTARTFETHRDVLLSITADLTATDPIATFGYGTDDVGRREWATQFGTAFGDFGAASTDATYYRYAYDGRGQLTGAQGYRGNDTALTTQPLPGRGFGYGYDDAGNRKTAGVSGDTASYWPTATAGSAAGEGANALNQPRSRGTLKTRVSGTSDKDAAITVGGVAAVRASASDRYWDAALPTFGQNATLTVSATLAGQTTQTATVQAVTRPGHETLAYDEDGNLISDAQWSYEWDAENRLRRMRRNATGASWGAPDRELEFTYDYVGRRIRKRVKENGAVTSDRKFLYDGWNLIAELDTTTGKIVRSHVWGLDVASSLSATGGVGALVLQTLHSDTALTSYHVAYDGGGNVTALVTRAPGGAGDGKVAVAYEYGPFGETVRAAVDPGLSPALRQELATQPFRFSTKFTDGETGLVYYGLRYYDPGLGRFLNRDPLGEAGGENLYAFVGNGPVNRLDVLGANPFATFWAWLTGSGKPTAADGRDGGGGGALTVYVGSDDDLGFNGLGDAIESGAVFQHGGLADAAARQQEAGTRRRYADWGSPNSADYGLITQGPSRRSIYRDGNSEFGTQAQLESYLAHKYAGVEQGIALDQIRHAPAIFLAQLEGFRQSLRDSRNLLLMIGPGGMAKSAAFPITRATIVARLARSVDIRVVRSLDSEAQVGFRGSLARGTKGPHKGNAPFNPNDFDVDAFVVSDKLAARFDPDVAFRNGGEAGLGKLQLTLDSTLRTYPEFQGLRKEHFTFRIFTTEEINKLQARGDAQIFIVTPGL